MIDLFPNAWHVARREYTTRVRTRTFAIVTAVLAVVGLGLALAPVLIRAIEGNSQTRIGLDAAEGTVPATTLGSILNAGDQAGNGWQVVAVTDVAAARAQVRNGDLDGLLTVTRAADGDLAFNAFSDAPPTDLRFQQVRSAATQLTVADRLERAGVDPGRAAEIFAPTRFQTEAVDPNTTGFMQGANGVLAYALVILTFMAVVTYGTWVANSVAEEKSSRVMELLITAATPRQLMAGKVLGAGAAGLTQYAVVLGAGVVGLALQATLAERLLGDSGGANALQSLDFSILLPFTAFFVPGFLLYCILYAGLGSMASRQEDVNQVTGPMLFVGMGGYFASFVAMATPAAAWVKILSLIPFFSPYLLTARTVLARNVQPWEWAVAAALMLLFLVGALWLAARIYSAGVLMYGQRSNLRSIWRAVRVNR
jgi:ABC-2 type transport system permease protein